MPPPTILVLHTDQQRFDTIGALGSPYAITPSLDRLCRAGTSFRCAYSSNPVCMAARHDLLTGASARHHGYFSNSGSPIRDYALPTIPRLLTQAGYQTIALGKMHHLPEREHHGFAHMRLMEELPSCRENDAYLTYLEQVGLGDVRCQHGVRPLFYHTPQPCRIPAEHHGSAWLAREVVTALATKRDRPLFLMASWVGPHPPYYVPESYLEMYRHRPLPLPCGVPPGSLHIPPSPENPELASARLRRIREAYYAAVTHIDDQIGIILDAIDQLGLLDDIIVLFTSDHGEMLGDRGGYQKHVPYEGSAHIPLIAMGPGFDAGGTVDAPVTTWDAAATILEAAGVKIPESMPLVGESLRTIAAREDRERITVYHHGWVRDRYVAAVGHGHKFIHWTNGGREELYDLANDPTEQRDLIGEADASATAALLRRACLDFEQRHGVAERVDGTAFVDVPASPVHPHYASLYPTWSSRQFPRWMNGYSDRDRQLIADEMRACATSEVAYICHDPAWRADAIACWQAIGGDPAVYRELFATVDANPSAS